MRRRALIRMREGVVAAFAVTLVASGCSNASRDGSAPKPPGTRLAPVYRKIVETGILTGSVSETGMVFLTAPSDGRVLVLGSAGDSAGTIGRVGDGPCEFRSITDFTPVGNGRAAIAEARLGRLQVCGVSGPVGGVTLLVPGQVLALTTAGLDSVVFVARIGLDTMAVFRVAITPQAGPFAAVDTLAVWRSDTIAARLGQLKTKIPILTVNRNGTLFAASSSDSAFRILEFGLGGVISTVVDRVESPIFYTDSELQERQDWIQRSIKRTGRPVPPPLPISEMKKIKPRFSWKALAITEDGSVLSRPASRPDSLVSLLVVAGGSRAEHRFLVAPPVRDIAVAGGFLATFGENPEGLGVVTLYRIPQ